jgi:hypothetical protein
VSLLQAALGEVVGGVQMCICGAKLPKDVAKHLNTKLHKDNCRRKGVQDVPDEVPMNEQVAPASLLLARTEHRSGSAIQPSRLQFDDSDTDEMADASAAAA